MRMTAMSFVLIPIFLGSYIVNAQEIEVKKWHFAANKGCIYNGHAFSDGGLCSFQCSSGSCVVQRCTNGTWQPQPSRCAQNTGCPSSC